MIENPFLTIEEAAAMLGVTAGRVRQMVAFNEIESIKLGKRQNVIPRTEVEKLVKKRAAAKETLDKN